MSAIPVGYKQTEVGVIPEDWNCSSVAQIASSTSNSIVGGPFGSDLVSNDYVPTGVPVVRGQNMGGSYVAGDFVFVSTLKAKKLQANTARADDIVFTQRGTLGQVSIVPSKPFGEYVISQSQMKLTLNRAVADTQYIYQYFSGVEGQKQITQSAIQTGVPHTNLGILKAYRVPLPSSVVEQRAIAAALSDVDALLAKLDQFIAKKRDLKQAAMQQLLTGQTRLPGFSGAWEVKRLGDVADPNQKWSFTGGPFGSNLKFSDYTDEGVRIIQLQNIGDGEFHDDYAIYTSAEKAVELLSCNVYPGDIILSKMGDPVARACLVPSTDQRYLMCSDGIRLAVDQTRFNTKFVFFQINASSFRSRAENAGTGSTRKRIGLTQLRNLELTSPSLGEQTAIATVLSDMDAELAVLDARRDKTRTLKQGMMQELLTGRIRLV